MWTRRKFIKFSFLISLCGRIINPIGEVWGKTKRLLPKGFPKEELKNMNPEEVDNRNLEVDPLRSFGTMGPTDVVVDIRTYRLKITGKVKDPLQLTYNEMLELHAITETVLLICPGFFSNNGRWTGVSFKTLLKKAGTHQQAEYLDIKGAYGKVVRISLKDIDRKRIFLAYQVNGEVLPQKHGFPLRLVYEGAYGYEWVKYVEELVVT